MRSPRQFWALRGGGGRKIQNAYAILGSERRGQAGVHVLGSERGGGAGGSTCFSVLGACKFQNAYSQAILGLGGGGRQEYTF